MGDVPPECDPDALTSVLGVYSLSLVQKAINENPLKL